jgi:dienelactone hydrolase
MTESIPAPISGVAAGVPFTALPPTRPIDGPAPLIVTWHMMDAPCTDAAFAAALPMTGVPAWRVHLGMPLCGARSAPNGSEAIVDLAREDIVLSYIEALVRQAAEEFPAALAELRARFPVDDGPIAVVGGSLGGAVASLVLAEGQLPVKAAALVNAGVRARAIVSVLETGSGMRYTWTERAERVADQLDFVARAGDIAVRTPRPPVLVVSGELDHPPLRTAAIDLVAALRDRYTDPAHVELVSVAGLEHPLAERPGLLPAPQQPTAVVVDKALTSWFQQHFAS